MPAVDSSFSRPQAHPNNRDRALTAKAVNSFQATEIFFLTLITTRVFSFAYWFPAWNPKDTPLNQMTEEITTSLLTKVLEWIPEHWHERINSSGTLLKIILEEALSDRDLRITGGAGAARAESALIAAFQKVLNRQEGKRFSTLVICPSRDSEELMSNVAEDMASKTALVVRATAPFRTKTSLISAFETPADVIITSLHGLEKLLDNHLLSFEQIRTVILDDIEWFQCLGELRQLERLTEMLPAACQMIGITAQGELNTRIVNLLHAPVICRAPELELTPLSIRERLIVVS
ncbi:protein containing DNA/RNA helicase, DEAD/DEAH box type, partial [gut metagenome]